MTPHSQGGQWSAIALPCHCLTLATRGTGWKHRAHGWRLYACDPSELTPLGLPRDERMLSKPILGELCTGPREHRARSSAVRVPDPYVSGDEKEPHGSLLSHHLKIGLVYNFQKVNVLSRILSRLPAYFLEGKIISKSRGVRLKEMTRRN